MKERSFIDTNILLYTDDTAYPKKQQRATALLESGWCNGNLVFSTQVLQEYFVAATRKLGVQVTIAQQKIELLSSHTIINIEYDDIVRAIELHRLYALSFWDALIVQAAEKSHCSVLYSEDMQHQQRIGKVQIINPLL